MTRRKVGRGEILFRKDEPAPEMFYVLAGEIRLKEVGRTIGSGAVLGEIGMFSPTGGAPRPRSARPTASSSR